MLGLNSKLSPVVLVSVQLPLKFTAPYRSVAFVEIILFTFQTIQKLSLEETWSRRTNYFGLGLTEQFKAHPTCASERIIDRGDLQNLPVPTRITKGVQ